MKLINRLKKITFREPEKDKSLNELKVKLSRYSNLLELATDGAATINIFGIVTYCNPAFIKLTGFNKNEIIGKHITKIPTLLKKDIPKYIKLFNSLINGIEIKHHDFVYKTKKTDYLYQATGYH